MDSVFLTGALVVLTYVTSVWILSLIKKDAGIMDIFWGPGFILLAFTFSMLSGWESWRDWFIFGLVALWGTRLALHIGIRNAGQPEDARYLNWRNQNGKSWWWKSFFKVFLLQGFVMWIVSLPVYFGRFSANSEASLVADITGASIFLFGFIYESIADYQLLKFKNDKSNEGKIYNGGLWKYSRHPNYFGESVLWWGLGIIAAFSGNPVALISPLIMTFLLLKVSGVKMLDKLMLDRRPDYSTYMRSTNAFIPGLRKS